jgi:lysozyme
MHSIEDQLVLHEGLRLTPYRCPAGYWTIGVGRNLETTGLSTAEAKALGIKNRKAPIEELKRRGITKDEALLLLANDVERCRADMVKYSWFRALDPVRQRVIIDMRFNLGLSGLLKFKNMILALNQGWYVRAGDEMKDSKWYGEVGQRGQRLVEMMRTGMDYVR